MKFKVGDKVIITEDHFEFEKGEEFIIIAIDSRDKEQSYHVQDIHTGRTNAWPYNHKITSIPYINEQKLLKKLGLS